jgi:BirA family biotin operon repressor/biotin-[acetyl-CoA-carboxylase] ligase
MRGRAGAPEGTVVTADAQERGRGRLGRTWFSPPGENLYLSVLLRPPLPPPRTPFLTLCAGVALAEAATATLTEAAAAALAAPPIAQLKWPNDLLLGRRGGPLRKAGGILTELVCSGGRVDFVVIGVGVNVNCLQFPPELVATSLRAMLPPPPPLLSVRDFATRLLSQLQARYQQFLAAGPGPILRAFESHADYLAQPAPITVHTGDRVLTGTPLGLADDGALLIRDAAGQLHQVVAGEITNPLTSGGGATKPER